MSVIALNPEQPQVEMIDGRLQVYSLGLDGAIVDLVEELGIGQQPDQIVQLLSQVVETGAIVVSHGHRRADVAASVKIHLTTVGASEQAVALVDCPPYGKPVFLIDGGSKEFHVRAGNTSRVMDVEEATSYIAQHWKGAA